MDTPNPSQTQTDLFIGTEAGVYTAALTNQTPGVFNLCYKLSDGLWALAVGYELTLILPTYTNSKLLTSVNSHVYFYNQAAVGDFVVLQNTPCGSIISAHLVQDTSTTQAKVALDDATGNVTAFVGSALSQYVFNGSKIYHHVCYATKESLGDSGDDYIDLNTPWSAQTLIEMQRSPVYAPVRIAQGSSPEVFFSHALAGDQYQWITGPDCTANARDGAPATTGSSETYTFVNASAAPTRFHDGLVAGSYSLCYKAYGSVYTRISAYDLTVIERPTFSPVVATRGQATLLTFSGVQKDDRIVITNKPCAMASEVLIDAWSLPDPMGRFTNYTGEISTLASMNRAYDAHVCFSTFEASNDGSHTGSDYTTLRRKLLLRPAPRFIPNRMIQGASQEVIFDRVYDGDKIIFLKGSSCNQTELDAGPSQSPQNTAVMTINRAVAYTLKTGADNPASHITTIASSIPHLVDIDHDGLVDLVLGDASGNLHYHRNTGSKAATAFTEVLQADGPFAGLSLSTTYTAPCISDLDNDGDDDMLIGTGDGSLRYFKNEAEYGAIASYTELTGTASPVDGISASAHSKPVLTDLDGDGDLDLILGSQNSIDYYENTGTLTRPVYTPRSGADNPFDSSKIGIFSFLSPALVDSDRDGDLDLILGEVNGVLRYFKNTGSRTAPVFTQLVGGDSPLVGLDSGDNSAPTLSDLDDDGDMDLIVGTTNLGELALFMDTTLITHTMASNLEAGSFIMCLKGNLGTGEWQRVEDDGAWNTIDPIHTMIVIAMPSFTPDIAISGMSTELAFVGAITDGDLLVLQPTNCVGAHLTSDTTTSMGKSPSIRGKFITSTSMTAAVTDLHACFATRESGGDSQDDYIELSEYLSLRPGPSIDIQRTTTLAPQQLQLSGGPMKSGDEVTVALENCSHSALMPFGNSSTYDGVHMVLAPQLTIEYAVTMSGGVYLIDGIAQQWLPVKHGHAYVFNLDDASNDADALSLSHIPNGEVLYTTTTYTVTLVSETQKYQFSANGAAPLPSNTELTAMTGNIYVFDMSDPSVLNHPLSFSLLPHGDSRVTVEFLGKVIFGKFAFDLGTGNYNQQPIIQLIQGYTYKFNMNDPSCKSHQFGLSLSNDGPLYEVGVVYELDGLMGISRQVFETSYSGASVRSIYFTPLTTQRVYYGRSPISLASHQNMGAFMDMTAPPTTEYHTNVEYKLDGVVRSYAQYEAEYTSATSRIVTYTPPINYYASHQLYLFAKISPQPDANILPQWSAGTAGCGIAVAESTNPEYNNGLVTYTLDGEDMPTWFTYRGNFSSRATRRLTYKPARDANYPHEGDIGPLWYYSATSAPGSGKGGPMMVSTSVDGTDLTSWDITLPDSLVSGTYQVCYRPWSNGTGGYFAPLNNAVIDVLPLPSFSPTTGMGGEATTITFSGSSDNDYVAMQLENCNDAHLTADSLRSATKRQITGEESTAPPPEPQPQPQTLNPLSLSKPNA